MFDITHNEQYIPLYCFVSMYYIICCMVPGHGRGNTHAPHHGQPQLSNSSFNYRLPPAWAPEMETQYSFRAWTTDLVLWVLLTDLTPAQQAAAISMRLGGEARNCVRAMSYNEIVNGGVVNGVQLDPVSYIIAGLDLRFAQMADESRLAAMSEFMAFAKYPHENINSLLTRYEVVRNRARTEGNFVMSIEGCALQIMRICHCNTQQFIQFLQPFGGRLPNTEVEFRDMLAAMRRLGHILEHSPNNIAMGLHGARQARSGQYHTDVRYSPYDLPTAQAMFGASGTNAQNLFNGPGYQNEAPPCFHQDMPQDFDSTDWAYLSGQSEPDAVMGWTPNDAKSL